VSGYCALPILVIPTLKETWRLAIKNELQAMKLRGRLVVPLQQQKAVGTK